MIRIGKTGADRRRQTPADAARSQAVIVITVAIWPQIEHGARRRQPFIDQDGVIRQCLDQPQRQHIRIDRAAGGLGADLDDQSLAPGRPVG